MRDSEAEQGTRHEVLGTERCEASANMMTRSVMKRRGWSTRVLLKYVLLQIPALALLILLLLLVQRWVALPKWFVWGLICLWVTKDVVLFPFVWRSYDSDQTRDEGDLVGAAGIAEENLAPSGYVRVRGELWKAQVIGNGKPIRKGERLHVEEVRGLTLIVRAEHENSS